MKQKSGGSQFTLEIQTLEETCCGMPASKDVCKGEAPNSGVKSFIGRRRGGITGGTSTDGAPVRT